MTWNKAVEIYLTSIVQS